MTNRPETSITTGQDAVRATAAELRAQLVERERQLASLTEQSLRILDDLAEARRNPPDRPEVLQRIATLEEMLRDARSRLRVGTRAVIGSRTPRRVETAHEVVLWDVPAHPHAELERVGDALGSAPVAVLTGPDHRIEDFDVAHETWSVFETPCRRPAHFWNEAMVLAEESTDVVVFVAAGVELEAQAAVALAAAAAIDGVAVASPLLLVGEQHFLGRTENGLMDLRAQPVTKGAATAALAFASPEVFAVSRAAFAEVGPFDQDLVGDLALAEWLARASSRALRCVGATDVVVRVPSLRAPANEALDQADRLIFLARHRPQQLMTAALASDALWQGEAGAVAATLRAAIARLPRAGEMPAAVDLLVHQASTVAEWKRIAPAVRERVASLCRELQLPAEGVRTDSALLSAVERAQEKVSALRTQVGAADSLRERIRQLEAELARVAAHGQQTERTLKDEMIARSNTIDALRNELLERERAIASLRQDLGHRQGEVQRFVDHLAQQQQEIQRLQEAKAKGAVEIERLRQVESELARLQGELSRIAEQGERSRTTAAEVEVAARLAVEAERQRSEVATREAVEAERRTAAEALREALEQQRTESEAAMQSVLEARSVVEQELAQSIERGEALAARLVELERRARDGEERLAAVEAARLLSETAARTRAEDVDRLRRDAATKQEQNELLRKEVETETQRAQAALQQIEVVQGVAAAKEKRIAELATMVGNLQASGDELARKVQVLTETIASLERNGQESRRAVESAHRERDELRRALDALREERAQVVARGEEIAQRLRERESWIVRLLDEVQQRRVSGRSLQPHEVEFVARLRGAKRP